MRRFQVSPTFLFFLWLLLPIVANAQANNNDCLPACLFVWSACLLARLSVCL